MSETRFLIVDDEEAIRDVIAAILEMGGVSKSRIDEAADGQEAWEKFTSNDAAYQILITDVKMPRMDGLQLIKNVLARYVGVKIVCLSGTDRIVDSRIDFLPKPFQNDQLWALVKNYA